MMPDDIPCVVGRCLSPVACGGFGYCRELNFRNNPPQVYGVPEGALDIHGPGSGEPAGAPQIYDADDNSEKQYQLWLKAAREIKIRAGLLPPDPDKPDEVRWAQQGSCKVSELDSARG